MLRAPFSPSIIRQANEKKRSISAEQEATLAETLAAWRPAIEKFSEAVLNLQAATSLTMDHRAGVPPVRDPNYCVTSELMSKALRTATGAIGNFMNGDAETPTIATRAVIETLIDMKFILQDDTGKLAERFHWHSLYNFLHLANSDLDGNRQNLEDGLAAAEQQHGDLSNWTAIGRRRYNLRERATCVGMTEDYDVWYRRLSTTVHSSFMGMRAFEPEDHYILGFSANSMHRPMFLIPFYLIQTFDEYRRGNKITVPNPAYYLRQFAKNNIVEIVALIPNRYVPQNEFEALRSLLPTN